MNDLTPYLAVRSQMRPGDLIAFWGSSPISLIINLFATGPSHVAIVRQGVHEGRDVKITESTIEGKRNGVQTNFLGETLANYGDGARAVWCPLSEENRRLIAWFKFYAFCGEKEDRVTYDVGGLFEFLARAVPIVGVRVAQSEKAGAMVCSAWCTAWYEAAGILRGVNWSKTSPEDLIEMRLFSRAVPILGNPKVNKRFNSV